MKNTLKEFVCSALQDAKTQGNLTLDTVPDVVIEEPKDEKMGDFATTIAMTLARSEKKNPRQIAEFLTASLKGRPDLIEDVQIAGPGFINFRLSREFLREQFRSALNQGAEFGKCDAGKGARVLVEFVSANPTGPLHVGHGRGAAVGDSLARLMKWGGYDVSTEYYINDVGNQMNNLGRSTQLRYREELGHGGAFPEDLYQGDYIRDIARTIIEKDGDRHLGSEDADALGFFRTVACDNILNGIKGDLKEFRVEFDRWFSEQTLHDSQKVEGAIQWLREKGFVYDKDGATWLKSSAFRDEKDRVVIKQGGEKTYFCADIAYHQDKLARGYDLILDIWGADHHGYVPRMEAVLEALGHGSDGFQVLLVQFVTLIRGGEKVQMSTRSGKFITLADVVDEVGVDATRFFFLMRSSDSHLDFDLELAKKETQENPVYYIQYAHARICSIFKTAEANEISPPEIDEVDLGLLDQPEDFFTHEKGPVISRSGGQKRAKQGGAPDSVLSAGARGTVPQLLQCPPGGLRRYSPDPRAPVVASECPLRHRQWSGDYGRFRPGKNVMVSVRGKKDRDRGPTRKKGRFILISLLLGGFGGGMYFAGQAHLFQPAQKETAAMVVAEPVIKKTAPSKPRRAFGAVLSREETSPKKAGFTFFETLNDPGLNNYVDLEGRVVKKGFTVVKAIKPVSTRIAPTAKPTVVPVKNEAPVMTVAASTKKESEKIEAKKITPVLKPEKKQPKKTKTVKSRVEQPTSEKNENSTPDNQWVLNSLKELQQPEQAFWVQAGSFKTFEKAGVLEGKLKKGGYVAFIRATEIPDKGTWYRVYLGQYPSREQAEQEAVRAGKTLGLKPVVRQAG